MARWQYTNGLHDIGNGCYAYLQPDGGWGWSNAGLVVDGRSTLLVDTLFDLPLTRAMLERMRAAVPAAAKIDTVVNTHGNPDHTFGNELVPGAEIIATNACVEDMRATPPEMLAGLMKNWRSLGEGAAFIHQLMGNFQFEGITLTLPTRTFDGTLSVAVGGKRVDLIEVGPAHTKGDTIVHVPRDRAVFTGDILFSNGHPIMWVGPVANWIAACDRILALDVDIVVPGHGPVTDKAGVRAMKHYLEYVRDEAKKRFDAGLDFEEAARDVALDAFGDWRDDERIVANVHALYREFRHDPTPPDAPTLFAAMSRYYAARHAGHTHGEGHR